jgi:hypothetical protein
VRDERDEVGAEGGEPAQLLHRRPLGLIGADVLDPAADQAPEQAEELDLAVAERAGLATHDGDRADRLGAGEERCDDSRAKPEREKVVLLLVLRFRHVLPVEGLSPGNDVLDDRALD